MEKLNRTEILLIIFIAVNVIGIVLDIAGV